MTRRTLFLLMTGLSIFFGLAGIASHYSTIRLRWGGSAQQVELLLSNDRFIMTVANRLLVSGVVEWKTGNPRAEYPRWRPRREYMTSRLDLRWEPEKYADFVFFGRERGTLQQVKVHLHPSKPLRIEEVGTKGQYVTIDTRCYLWALFLGLWPAMYLAGFSRKRYQAKSRNDICPSCGYDLRGTPHLCPECGRIRENQEKPGD